MESNEPPQRKVIFIRLDSNDKSLDPDPEILAWLERFIRQAENETINFNDLDHGEPSEIEQLEYLDGTISGDHHPEALAAIMDAYRKHQEGSNDQQ